MGEHQSTDSELAHYVELRDLADHYIRLDSIRKQMYRGLIEFLAALGFLGSSQLVENIPPLLEKFDQPLEIVGITIGIIAFLDMIVAGGRFVAIPDQEDNYIDALRRKLAQEKKYYSPEQLQDIGHRLALELQLSQRKRK